MFCGNYILSNGSRWTFYFSKVFNLILQSAKKINYYIEQAQVPIYNDILTEKPVNTIIGYSIDNFFLEKYYDITSPSWVPVQINEANFIALTSIKVILDFLYKMPYRIKATKDLLNAPGFNFKM